MRHLERAWAEGIIWGPGVFDLTLVGLVSNPINGSFVHTLGSRTFPEPNLLLTCKIIYDQLPTPNRRNRIFAASNTHRIQYCALNMKARKGCWTCAGELLSPTIVKVLTSELVLTRTASFSPQAPMRRGTAHL